MERITNWETNPLGAKPKDVLEIPTISNGTWEKYPHETQMPVELIRENHLIILITRIVVLLVFIGSSDMTYAVAEAYQCK